ESVNAATGVLTLLKQHGYKLVADVGSPIDILNRATNTALVYDNTITDEQFLQRLSDMSKVKRPESGTGEDSVVADTPLGTEALRIDDHEPTLFDLRRMSVQRCSGMLDFGRNVVQPFIQQVLSGMDNAQAAEVTEDWELVPVVTDPILGEPVIQALISRLERPQDHNFSYERFPAKVPSEIPAPVTGKKAYDDLVGRLLGEMAMTPSQAMSEVLFDHTTNPISELSYLEVRKYAIALLLAAFYHDNPWPDSGVSITAWRTMMLTIMNAAASWLWRFGHVQEAIVKTGTVVRYYDRTEKKVFINSGAFEKFVGMGGTPECLLGAIYQLDDGGPQTISLLADELVKNSEMHMAAWDRRSSLRRMEADTDWLRNNRNAMKVAMTEAINVIDEELLPEGKEQALRAACSAIDCLFTAQTSDVTEFIMQIACNSVFIEYDVYRLLEAVHRGVVNGETPEAAATDWMIDYYLDYTLAGVLIEK
ncbi:MAG: hypothetical protein ACRC8I_11335, partial [Plesiomonas shigelloides]